MAKKQTEVVIDSLDISSDYEVSDNIKSIFLQHPHIHTVWVNGDEWCFYDKPGFTPIDRHVAIKSGE